LDHLGLITWQQEAVLSAVVQQNLIHERRYCTQREKERENTEWKKTATDQAYAMLKAMKTVINAL